MSKTILITGASGNIGSKLRAHFAALGQKLVLIDRKRNHETRDRDVVVADLSQYDPSWATLFTGVDAVIHLAADRNPGAGWNSIIPNNVLTTQNVMRAAIEKSAKRLIYVSSTWTMAGYQFTGPEKLTTVLETRPVNPYGMSKLLGEQLAACTPGCPPFIALRLGYCQDGANNRPGAHMAMGSWGQLMWLSDRDLCQGMEKAVLAADVTYAVLNLISNNPGMRWDIENTCKVIGYEAQDGAAAVMTPAVRQADEQAKEAFTRAYLSSPES